MDENGRLEAPRQEFNGFVVVLRRGKPANTHYVLPLGTAQSVRSDAGESVYVYWEEFSTYALAKKRREQLNFDNGLTVRVDTEDPR